MLNDIRITRIGGALGKSLPSQDATTGLLCYLNAIPSGLENKTLRLASLAEAVEANILDSGDTQILWYHIAEFFRICPNGVLFLKVLKDASQDNNYNAVFDLQNFAEGEIRQLGVFVPKRKLDKSHLANLQARAQSLEESHQPLSIIFAPQLASSDIASLPDLTTLTHSRVSVLIGQDGGGLGKNLKNSSTLPSVSCIGACLGSIAKAKVSESIAWVEKHNLVSTAYPNQKQLELDLPALSDGSLISQILPSQLATLNDKGYIFVIKHVGIGGSYFNSSSSADKVSSDFCNIYANRTLDKVARLLRTTLLPKLSAPIKVNEQGQIPSGVTNYWQSLCAQTLEKLRQNEEISSFAVFIDPEQNVISNQALAIELKVVPIGVAQNINVQLSYALKLS